MDRAQHLQWCKKRALEYADRGDPAGAIASMISDLSKHEGTARHAGIHLTGMLVLGGHLITIEEVRRHIEGFN